MPYSILLQWRVRSDTPRNSAIVFQFIPVSLNNSIGSLVIIKAGLPPVLGRIKVTSLLSWTEDISTTSETFPALFPYQKLDCWAVHLMKRGAFCLLLLALGRVVIYSRRNSCQNWDVVLKLVFTVIYTNRVTDRQRTLNLVKHCVNRFEKGSQLLMTK